MCLQRFRLRVVLGYAQLFDLHCLGKAAASGQVNTCPLLCLGRECLSYKKLLLSHAFLQQQQAKILLTSDFYNSNITAFLCCRVTILCLYTQPDGWAGTEILHLYKIRLFCCLRKIFRCLRILFSILLLFLQSLLETRQSSVQMSQFLFYNYFSQV